MIGDGTLGRPEGQLTGGGGTHLEVGNILVDIPVVYNIHGLCHGLLQFSQVEDHPGD